MTDTPTRATYTLTMAGLDWVFGADAADALAAAGQSPLLFAIALGATNSLQPNVLTEVTIGDLVLNVKRRGRRITVTPATGDQSVKDAGEETAQDAQGRVKRAVMDSGAKNAKKATPRKAQGRP
jgi:hypothetical protein